tara:strand:- start:680 stop:1012 length:333 start_codon:yes stop_codon:yes gene_type:complete
MSEKIKKDSLSRKNKDKLLSQLHAAGFDTAQIATVAENLDEVTVQKGTRVSSHRVQIANHPKCKKAYAALETARESLNKQIASADLKFKKRGSDKEGTPYVDIKVSIITE